MYRHVVLVPVMLTVEVLTDSVDRKQALDKARDFTCRQTQGITLYSDIEISKYGEVRFRSSSVRRARLVKTEERGSDANVQEANA